MAAQSEARRLGRRDYMRRWRANHPGENARKMREWRKLNPDKNYDKPEKSRARALKRRYGMTVAQFEEMVVKQEGKCATCLLVPVGRTAKACILHIDHDHATGKVRGLLCHRCNTALGLLREDPKVLDRLRGYLNA